MRSIKWFLLTYFINLSSNLQTPCTCIYFLYLHARSPLESPPSNKLLPSLTCITGPLLVNVSRPSDESRGQYIASSWLGQDTLPHPGQVLYRPTQERLLHQTQLSTPRGRQNIADCPVIVFINGVTRHLVPSYSPFATRIWNVIHEWKEWDVSVK